MFHKLKLLKFMIIIISLFFLKNNIASANNQSTYQSFQEIDNCLNVSNGFYNYKISLIKCFDKKNISLTTKHSANLSNEIITKEQYKNIAQIDQFIKTNPQFIFGVDNVVRKLEQDGLISKVKKEELLLNSYNNFNPSLLLSLSSQKTNSSDLANAILAGATLLAIDTMMSADQSATVNLSSSTSSVGENSGTSVSITANITSAQSSTLSVNLSISGTATEGTDFSTITRQISIPAGGTSGSISFTPINDNISDINETIIISISSLSGGENVNKGSATSVTIIDDEAIPSVSLSASASSIAENSGTITLTATSSIISSSNIVVSLASSGTATSGSDYGAISSITIPAGSTSATATFTPTDDSLYDGGNETAIFDISSISGGSATENGTQQVTITLTDNESAPTVTLTSSASSIAENSGSSVTLTATLSGGTDESVTVSLSTAGTGTEGTDYGTISDITISAGSTTGTATLTPTDDVIYEGNETAIVDISGVSGGGATESGSQSETITITENESAPTVIISSRSSSGNEENSSQITITATLSNATTANVTVSIGTSGTATEGSDYDTVLDITINAGSTTGTSNFNVVNEMINTNVREKFMDGYDYDKLCLYWYNIFKNLNGVEVDR